MMDETYTYGVVEYKRIGGKWHEYYSAPNVPITVRSPPIIAMLDALHPEPPVRVTLNGDTYDRVDGTWYRAGVQILLPMYAALNRIVELGGADGEVQP